MLRKLTIIILVKKLKKRKNLKYGKYRQITKRRKNLNLIITKKIKHLDYIIIDTRLNAKTRRLKFASPTKKSVSEIIRKSIASIK